MPAFSDELVGPWRDLVADDPDATVFHTPDFLATWARTLAPGLTPRCRTLWEGDRLVGLAPETVERVGSAEGPRAVVRFLGGEEVTDYQGPVARPADRDRVADAYMAELAGDRTWDDLDLQGLGTGGWADLLEDAAKRHGLEVLERARQDVCPRVDLHGGFDGYLERLPGKLRHEQRRKARKLSRDAGEVELVEAPPDEVRDRLSVFLDMAHEAEDEKARFFLDDDKRAFFGELADALAADGRFRLHVLEVGGLPGAATLSLVDGTEWGLYNSAFDQALTMLSPGIVLITHLLQVAADEGFEVFDLLRGDEPYKYRFGAEDRSLLTAAFQRP